MVEMSNEHVADNAYGYNLLESSEYLCANGEYVVPIGRTERGTVVVEDLSQVPHILVCGCTGSGKTSFVQMVITTLIYKYLPDDIGFLIYDSKALEYDVFEKIPHLVRPIDITSSEAVYSLNWLADEMKRRFQLLINAGCRDRLSYNEYCETSGRKKLKSLFVVLDDFSMITVNKDTLSTLKEIFQNGRIVGVHMILVTSQVNNKTIQRELMSFIPCKISFCLSTKGESKLVFDDIGAEDLYIPGELIYKHQSRSVRCQGAFIQKDMIGSVITQTAQIDDKVYDRIKRMVDKIWDEPLPDIEISALERFKANDTTYWIENNKIYTLREGRMNNFHGLSGSYQLTIKMTARGIKKISLKMASVFSKGYISFLVNNNVSFTEEEPVPEGLSKEMYRELIHMNVFDDIEGKIITYEFHNKNNSSMKMFVDHIHNNTGIPIIIE